VELKPGETKKSKSLINKKQLNFLRLMLSGRRTEV
jgi:hypothetical protein